MRGLLSQWCLVYTHERASLFIYLWKYFCKSILAVRYFIKFDKKTEFITFWCFGLTYSFHKNAKNLLFEAKTYICLCFFLNLEIIVEPSYRAYNFNAIPIRSNTEFFVILFFRNLSAMKWASPCGISSSIPLWTHLELLPLM